MNSNSSVAVCLHFDGYWAFCVLISPRVIICQCVVWFLHIQNFFFMRVVVYFGICYYYDVSAVYPADTSCSMVVTVFSHSASYCMCIIKLTVQ